MLFQVEVDKIDLSFLFLFGSSFRLNNSRQTEATTLLTLVWRANIKGWLDFHAQT